MALTSSSVPESLVGGQGLERLLEMDVTFKTANFHSQVRVLLDKDVHHVMRGLKDASLLCYPQGVLIERCTFVKITGLRIHTSEVEFH